MESTQDRQLAVPALAERARTLAARGRTATVVAAGTTDRPMPMLYQIHRAGSPQSPLPNAEPDPFCRLERAWLRHLEQYPSAALRTVARHLPCARLGWDIRVRPLRIDRLGLRLRIEDVEQTQDIRLAFHRPATTPVRLASELYGLLGCTAAAQNTR